MSGKQATREAGTWFGRVCGSVTGRIGRMDYFKGVLLVFLLGAGIGQICLAHRPDLFHVVNAGTPEAINKLMLPAMTVPLRLFWVYLDTKRLRALGLPPLLALVAHGLFFVDLTMPDFVVPTLPGLIFYVYLACLLLLPSATKLVGHSRTGRKLTILGMQERE